MNKNIAVAVLSSLCLSLAVPAFASEYTIDEFVVYLKEAIDNAEYECESDVWKDPEINDSVCVSIWGQGMDDFIALPQPFTEEQIKDFDVTKQSIQAFAGVVYNEGSKKFDDFHSTVMVVDSKNQSKTYLAYLDNECIFDYVNKINTFEESRSFYANGEPEIPKTQVVGETTEVEESTDNSVLTLTPGTYIVGEDIDAGVYNFVAVSGRGQLYVCGSIEKYFNDRFFSSFYNERMAEKKICDSSSIEGYYISEMGNVRLSEGYCVGVEGVTLKATVKK